MSVLLMRLAGPMQSWSTRSRFTNRDTGLEPRKSGVLGLLCGALGWSRDAPSFAISGQSYTLEKFSQRIGMAVRVDREGRLMRDYHTAENCRKADGTMPQWSKRFVESERFYLADADFLVGLAGDSVLLMRLDQALRRPVWPLFLGRKSFLPSIPVSHGVVDRELLDALQQFPWRKRYLTEKTPHQRLRGIVEVQHGQGEPRPDVPLSFASRDRRFAVRHVKYDFFPIPQILEPDGEPSYVSQQVDP